MRISLAMLNLHAIGDSITQGAGVADNLLYHAWLGNAKGMNRLNTGIGATRITDFCETQGYRYTIGDRDRTIIMPGMNDKWGWIVDGEAAEGRAQYQRALKALLAFMAIPATKKTLAQAGGSYTGTWSNSTYYGGAVGKISAVNGSTVTFVVRGTTIILGTTRRYSLGGALDVTVDGVAQTQISCSGGIYSATPPSGLVNDRAWHPEVTIYTGLSDVDHTVVLTCVSDGSHYAQVDWIAGIPSVLEGFHNKVLCSSTLRQAGTTYDAETIVYNGYNVAIVNELYFLGLPVKYSDTYGGCAYDPDNATYCTDGIHPTAAGHAVLGAKIISDW